jgi:hypothetical protein
LLDASFAEMKKGIQRDLISNQYRERLLFAVFLKAPIKTLIDC